MDSPAPEDALDASLDDIEYLARSDHRVRVLNALAEGPRVRADLRSTTGASPPTMSRILGDFVDRRWIRRSGPTYELTPLGRFVTDRVADLCTAMTTERKLRAVWPWLPREMAGFSVDLFADAVVSYPGPGYPYEPIDRMAELTRATRSVRGFGTVVLKAGSLETICGAVVGGMELEYIFSPDILAATLDWDADRIAEIAGCEHCRLLVHDDLPDGDRCGLNILDDRVAICGHDPDTGALRAIIDTDAPAAREWAVDLFERMRREASPVEQTGDARLRSATGSA